MDGVNWSSDVNSYIPLPKSLTIKQSPIHGLGLFAVKDLSAGYVAGVSHVEDERFPNGFIRTPLGAFINYSKRPNSTFVSDEDLLKLKTLRQISAGEELTADYEPWYDEKTLGHFR